jgi:hypothetical protein
MYMTLNFGTYNNLPRCSGVVPRCKSARRDLSVCLVGGQICMGWDGLDIVDEMIHVRVIPCFVWFHGFEEWYEMCLYLIYLLGVGKQTLNCN